MVHRKKTSQREWRRMDLHLHTPASIDYKQQNVSYLDFLKKAEEKNLDIIAFADHNTAMGYARYLEEIESLELLERLKRLRDEERKQLEEYRRLREKILILPGFEFTATLGFHILGIFPPDTTVRELEHLLLSLRVPPDKLDQGSGEVGATTDALTAYRMINEAGGLVIAAHANSSHGVAMPGFDFGGQTRIAYTQDSNLLALEVTDLESRSRRRTSAFFSGTKPEYPRRMHCIQSSDAHKLDFDPRYKNEMGVGDRATEILIDDVSFEAIKELFQGNDFSRTRPYRPAAEEPFDPIRDAREQGETLVQSFHERLMDRRAVERAILEDVVALANTNGGTVYIGASATAKNPVLGIDHPEHAIAELRAAISKGITPPLDVQIEVLKSQGKSVLQMIVPRGIEVPYAFESSHIYVRSENETSLAMRDEIVQLVRDALAVEFAAMPPASPAAEPHAPAVAAAATATTTAEAEPKPVPLVVDPPRTGVEIVSTDVRKGVKYYSVRDLRNARIVHNVTLASARRLWQYAIEEHEKSPCDPRQVQWTGDIGVWKTYKRGGKSRQDLVQRAGDRLFVYYGVTEDGIHGAWRKLVEGENGAEEEQAAELATAADQAGVPAEAPAEETRWPELPLQEETEPREELEPTASEFEEPTAAEPAQAPQFGEPGEPMRAEAAPAEEPRPEIPPTSMETPPAQAATPAAIIETPPAQLPLPTAAAEPPRAVALPAETSLAPKTRAQTWREKLDRAMAEARAAHQTEPMGQPGESAAPARDESKAEDQPQPSEGTGPESNPTAGD